MEHLDYCHDLRDLEKLMTIGLRFLRGNAGGHEDDWC